MGSSIMAIRYGLKAFLSWEVHWSMGTFEHSPGNRSCRLSRNLSFSAWTAGSTASAFHRFPLTPSTSQCSAAASRSALHMNLNRSAISG